MIASFNAEGHFDATDENVLLGSQSYLAFSYIQLPAKTLLAP